MLKPARVVVVLDELHFLAECERDVHFQLVFLLVLPVLTHSLGIPELRSGKRLLTNYLAQIIVYALRIDKGFFLKAVLALNAQQEFHTVVYYSLPSEHILQIFSTDIYIREYLQVRLPVYLGSRIFAEFGLFEAALVIGNIKAFFKAQRIFPCAVAALNLHIFRGKLRGAKPQSVKPQRVGVILTRIVIVLSARVQCAERQFPVVFILALVEIYRDTAPPVLYGNGMIGEKRYHYLLSIALACLVNGI